MEMKTLSKMEKKTIKNTSSDFLKLGLAFAFMAITMWWSYTTHGDVNNSLFLGIGALFGAYMAMNIGANDVANNWSSCWCWRYGYGNGNCYCCTF